MGILLASSEDNDLYEPQLNIFFWNLKLISKEKNTYIFYHKRVRLKIKEGMIIWGRKHMNNDSYACKLVSYTVVIHEEKITISCKIYWLLLLKSVWCPYGFYLQEHVCMYVNEHETIQFYKYTQFKSRERRFYFYLTFSWFYSVFHEMNVFTFIF